MTHLIILGTSHPLQCGHASISPALVQAFEAELLTLFRKYGIARVAEEMNQDGLARHKVTSTVAQRLTQLENIEHHNVDIERCERTSLGMHDGPLTIIRDFYQPEDGGRAFRDAMSILEGEVRERVWIYRLLDRKTTPVLFVCGASHVEPVARIWRMLGLPCCIAHYDYAA